eukprot:TRINITY_DN4104_c1_g2_i1.p1 TRINITY_DN4104_c1_g2~~TRINITY_DN4104_c1_g2_i1.p1  ORF type:complete len:307 (-),score=31.55 TRINITY_DN4104_c1_g2_i1:1411-2331(-)
MQSVIENWVIDLSDNTAALALVCSAGGSCLLTLVFWFIFLQLPHYLNQSTSTRIQSLYMKIGLLVPTTVFTSGMGLLFVQASYVFQTVNVMIKGLVFYWFIETLFAFVGSKWKTSTTIENMDPSSYLPTICCCFKNSSSHSIINNCYSGVVQFSVTKLILVVIELVIKEYDTDPDDMKNFTLLLNIIEIVSMIICLISYTTVYNATKDITKQFNTEGKLNSIRAYLIITGLQSIILNILHFSNVLPAIWPDEQVNCWNNILSCFEIFGICVLFIKYWSVDDFYQEPSEYTYVLNSPNAIDNDINVF